MSNPPARLNRHLLSQTDCLGEQQAALSRAKRRLAELQPHRILIKFLYGICRVITEIRPCYRISDLQWNCWCTRSSYWNIF